MVSAGTLGNISLLLGALSTLFCILSLSLDEWQGNTLTPKEIMRSVGQGNRFSQQFSMFGNSQYGMGMKPTTTMGYGSDWADYSSNAGGFDKLGSMVREEVPSENPNLEFFLNSRMTICMGLWHLCVKDIQFPVPTPGFVMPEICISLEGWLSLNVHVPRTMLFLALFILLGSVICTVLKLYVMQDRHTLLFISSGLAFTAGFFLMASFAYYADVMTVDFFNYHGAFYICVFSWLLSWVSGSILLTIRITNKDISVV